MVQKGQDTGEKERVRPTCVEIYFLASNCPPQESKLRDLQLLCHVDGILIVFPG
jgi:hypothetical protein